MTFLVLIIIGALGGFGFAAACMVPILNRLQELEASLRQLRIDIDINRWRLDQLEIRVQSVTPVELREYAHDGGGLLHVNLYRDAR